jgi:hypothetical protein
MPEYVSVASSYCKVEELARTCGKHTERARRWENTGEPTIVDTGKGRKLVEETRSI